MIDFNHPTMVGNEMAYIRRAYENDHLSGDGPFSKQCHRLLEELLSVPKALLTSSCTDALEMSALLLNIQPGDEVIVPSFTFVSTVNAYVLRGARPVFIDIRPDTMNMNERILENLITPKTRAILPVHYAGVGCEMETIIDIARRHNLAVVEDNAHGFLGKYRGQYLGTFGCMATQSFHETKNFSCGEGGALLINDPNLIEKGEIIREKGTNRSRFFRGQVDKYTWVDVGSSFLISDILAAVLYAQLEAREQIQARRKQIWNTYYQNLKDWAAAQNIQLPHVPTYCEQAFHMFYMVLPDLSSRQALMAHLKSRQINSVFHYQPLHTSVMGQKFGGKAGECPVTERIADTLLRLPFYNSITEADQEQVITALYDFTI